MNLHGEIINLQCRVPNDANINQILAWKNGHKQARHDAAELAASADAEMQRMREALENLLDAFERCEAGFPPEIELRFLVRDLAKSALVPNAMFRRPPRERPK